MKTNDLRFWQVCSLILAIITIVLIVAIAMVLGKEVDDEALSSDDFIDEDNGYWEIMLNEDLMVDKRVENLENLRWSHARIMQDSNNMEVSITLTNESLTDRIEARELIIQLLNKKGKVIGETEVQLPAMEENYDWKEVEVKFDLKELQIVYDIHITAKENASTEEQQISNEEPKAGTKVEENTETETNAEE